MALEGSLCDMPLVDLIQVFQTWPKTGFLLLVNMDERGVLYVDAGTIVDAIIVRGTDQHILAFGEVAVLELLEWKEAHFTFHHNPAAHQRPVRITHDSGWLLQEANRRNGHAQPSPTYITLDAHLELAPLPTTVTQRVNLGRDQWQLLSLIATYKNLRNLCQHTELSPERAMNIAQDLVTTGLIEVIVQPSSTPTALPSRRITAKPSTCELRGRTASVTTAYTTRMLPERGLLHAVMRRIRNL